MGLFDSIMGRKAPVNREELIAICEKKIANGEYQEAAKMAQEYKKKIVDSHELSEYQKNIDLSYAYYLIGKAVFKIIQSTPTNRTYDHFKAFFAAHRLGCQFFQDILMKNDCEWDEENELYPYYERLRNFYDDLYNKYGSDPEVERADIEANEVISSAIRGY